MALTNAAKGTMLDALAGSTVYASLHTGDPGTSGTSEVTGGSYGRQAITWAAASGGSKSSSSIPAISVPASTTVGWFGLYSAATSGTFLGGGSLSASETYGGAGTYNLSVTVTLT